MRSVALLLFGIHHIFADPLQINVRCANVIGSVGEKFTLTCGVYIPRDACCITIYNFRSDDDQTICKKRFNYKHCTQLTSFSCPYTAYAAMTTKFKFFLQATCGQETAEFTLDVKEPTIPSKTIELTKIHVADPLQINIRCANVIGSVGEELTLTCSVDIPRDACCIAMYKFRKTTSNDQTICRKELSTDPCLKLTSFSCPYTAYAAMTTKFKFFLQATCGHETAEFTLDVKEPTIPSIKTIDVIPEEELTEIHVAEPTFLSRENSNVIPEDELTNTHLAVTAGCVLALTVCVAILGAIVWMKSRQVKRRNLTGYLTGSSMDTDSMSDEQILIHSSGSMDRPINF